MYFTVAALMRQFQIRSTSVTRVEIFVGFRSILIKYNPGSTYFSKPLSNSKIISCAQLLNECNNGSKALKVVRSQRKNENKNNKKSYNYSIFIQDTCAPPFHQLETGETLTTQINCACKRMHQYTLIRYIPLQQQTLCRICEGRSQKSYAIFLLPGLRDRLRKRSPQVIIVLMLTRGFLPQ